MQALKRLCSLVLLAGCSPTDENVLPQGTPQTPEFSRIPQPLALSVLPNPSPRPSTSDTSPQYASVVQDLVAQFNAKSLLPLERFFDTHVTVHNVGATQLAHVEGVAAFTMQMTAMLSTYEKLEMHPVRLLESGNAVVLEYVSIITAKLPKKPKKTIRLPAAMVFIFNKERKITELWSFQNELFVLQEMDILPEPISYTPYQPKLTQPLAVISGEGNPLLAVTHQQFREFLTSSPKEGQLESLVSARFKGQGPQRPIELNRSDLLTYTSLRQATFPDLKSRSERDFLAGNFHAALVTYESSYRGSPKISPAKRIIFNTLEVIGVNEEGLIETWATYINPLQIYRQMGLYDADMAKNIQKSIRPTPPEGESEMPTLTTVEQLAAFPEERIGLEVCDRLLSHLRKCAPYMDAHVGREYLLSLSAAYPSWRLLAKGNATQRESLTRNCQDLHNRLQVHFNTTCPHTP